METIAKLLEKISTYQILNYMIPGGVLCVLLKYWVGYNIIDFSIAENVIIVYFVGMVNSRLSSLVLKKILKKTHFIKETDPEEFIKAEKRDAKLTVLSDINNMFRSMTNVMLLLLIAYGLKHISCIETFVLNNINWIAIASLFVLFLFSFREQTRVVKKRIETDNKEK